ncbi:MAG: FliO/MopB family protein [Planctomycetia bacterium]|nr:FliO/MopB family protein [Planctomycetia bacterium]
MPALAGTLILFALPLSEGAQIEQVSPRRTPWSNQPAQTTSPGEHRDEKQHRGTPARPAGFAREVDNEQADEATSTARPSAALAPRSATRPNSRQSVPLPAERSSPPALNLSPMVTTGASLAVVLGLFLLLAWALKRKMPQASTPLPGEVLEVLGRGSLPGKHTLHLVRCGAKLLLVCTAPSGPETLTEISDPDEVARLAALCREANPRSSSRAFHEVLREMEREPHAPGFADAPASRSSTGPRPPEVRRG